MKHSRIVFAMRIFAVLFSVALATTYVACQGGSDQQGQDSLNEDPAVMPSTKSAPMDYNIGNFDPVDGEEQEKAPEPKGGPAVLPGSKSIKINPNGLFPGSKSSEIHLPDWIIVEPVEEEKDTRPEGIPNPLKELEEANK